MEIQLPADLTGNFPLSITADTLVFPNRTSTWTGFPSLRICARQIVVRYGKKRNVPCSGSLVLGGPAPVPLAPGSAQISFVVQESLEGNLDIFSRGGDISACLPGSVSVIKYGARFEWAVCRQGSGRSP
uniref:Uncharacterized protein n=1 Tax=Chromera velia CCMP2878 TaxID=1169474 RepID=A0A0G4F1L0_9ALVE|eukprot:Cvel_14667.t1-p1 / transcript=Cvel_14667.t1 / gene=Cvel_14667 / organism=Chromera_velia_CCMP2878 / gene_product=hypothetical protein / transcript_product=hypothetical protein / location=Cvel_scaffold1051:40743-41126(+) / protein_length=128 / sequence_SO=supercontig / SO=protein_coding / is_pseudo=false